MTHDLSERLALQRGAQDARNGTPSRSAELPTVSEQLAYSRGYKNPEAAERPDVMPQAIRKIAKNLRVAQYGAGLCIVSEDGYRLSEGFHYIIPTVAAGEFVCTVECSLGARRWRMVLDVEGRPVGEIESM